MYEWLEREIAAVRTPKFFLTAGPSDDAACAARTPEVRMTSYGVFAQRFGKSEFFRDSTDCYAIGVLDRPELDEDGGNQYWNIGWYDGRSVFIGPVDDPRRRRDADWPVFEHTRHGRFAPMGCCFNEWLEMRWRTARKQFSAAEWRQIVKGPEPFTAEELKIIEARRRFRWRLLDVGPDGTLQLEVTNESDRRLPYIGIRAHGKRRGVWVGLAVRIDHIPPGGTAVIEHRGLVALKVEPDEVELFPDPDPAPEDREFYWEFRPLPNALGE